MKILLKSWRVNNTNWYENNLNTIAGTASQPGAFFVFKPFNTFLSSSSVIGTNIRHENVK